VSAEHEGQNGRIIHPLQGGIARQAIAMEGEQLNQSDSVHESMVSSWRVYDERAEQVLVATSVGQHEVDVAVFDIHANQFDLERLTNGQLSQHC
jgi:AmiR/NasT family two-component response regulator